MNNDQNTEAEVCACGVHDQEPIRMPIPGHRRARDVPIQEPPVARVLNRSDLPSFWRVVSVTTIVVLLVALAGSFSAMDRSDTTIRELGHRLDVERAQSERNESSESGRQCMITVARGDYDDFLRQLGWSRAPHLTGNGSLHACPVNTQGDAKWPNLIDDESDGTMRAQDAHAGASSSSRTDAWFGTLLGVVTSSGSRPDIHSGPDRSVREAERSSLSRCQGSSGTDDDGCQPDRHGSLYDPLGMDGGQ